MPTIYDVAQLASVSPATVSRVMNDRGNVRSELALRVHEAIATLDYRPNSVARSLRRQTSAVWGLIFSDVETAHFTSITRGVEDVAQSVGRSVVLCNTDDDVDKERRYIEVAVAERMSGVVLSPASGRRSCLDLLTEAGIPVVTVDRRLSSSTVDAVLVKNAAGAALAVEHLLASGYRRVACITGPAHISTATGRLAGYRRALEARGVTYRPELVRRADFREGGGYEATRSLLEGDDPPDAIFVTNSVMAMGSLECVADLGIEVPRTLGIVAFDDHPWARLLRPSLTTVAQPTYELGRLAARMLLERADDPHRRPVTVSLTAELIVRESSVPPR